MKKVYIVGFELKGKDGSTGGFDWYINEADADQYFTSEQSVFKEKFPESIIYRGSLEVPNGTQQEITDYIENFLSENDWENSFGSIEK